MFSLLTEWFHDASHVRSTVGCVNHASRHLRESRNLQIKLARGNQSHFAPESHLIRNVMHIGRYVFRLFVANVHLIIHLEIFLFCDVEFRFSIRHHPLET